MTLTAPVIGQAPKSTWTDGVTIKLNDLNSTYSRYVGTSTVLTAASWITLTWPTLAEGTGQGVSVASSTTFTLTQAGLWTVNATLITGTASGFTGALFGLFRDNTFTSGLIYDEDQAPVLVSQAAGTLSAEITSTGATTLLVAVFAVGGSPSMSTAGGTPRLTLSCKDA